MSKRLLALLTAGLLLAGCASRAPVQAPPETRPAPAVPAAPVPAPAPAPAPAAPAAPTPAAPKPAVTVPDPVYPAPTIPVLRPVDLLQQAEQASWQMAKLKPLLPPVEGRYQNTSGEDPNLIQYAYLGGALRLYVDSGDQHLLGFMVDTRFGPYADAAQLVAGSQSAVRNLPPYVVVLHSHPLAESLVDQLKSKAWSQTELAQLLGKPSYKAHLHGVGSFILTYLPEGLTFEGNDTYQLRLEDPYATVQPATLKGFAQSMQGELMAVQKALAGGKSSPDGRFRAGKVSWGGYWDDWLFIQEPGKAEQRYQSDYFLMGFDWLDDRTLIYSKVHLFGDEHPFYTINALTGEQKEAIRVQGWVEAFGVSAPGQIWYTTEDKARHEAAIGQ